MTKNSTRAGGPTRRQNVTLGVALLLGLGLVVAVPPAFVLYYSVADMPGITGEGFNLDGWRRMADSGRTVGAIVMSFILAVRVPLGVVIAFLMAWALTRTDLPGRRFLHYALWFTFFLPVLPMTFGWMILAHENYGLLNELLTRLPLIDDGVFSIQSAAGIVWVHLTLSTVPIMTLLLAPAFERIDASYEEASEMAGAGRVTTLLRISLPLLAPAALTAGLAGLVKSLEAFELEQVLGVPVGIDVFATRVYDLLAFTPADYKQAMALSSLFLMILFVLAFVYQFVLRRYRGVHTTENRGGRHTRPARTWRTWAIGIAMHLSVVIAVGLPFAVLILGSFNRLFGFFFLKNAWTTAHWQAVLTNNTFLDAARTSFVVALLAATVGSVLYALLGRALARGSFFGREVLSLVIWLPWAVPGVLLGTAILSVFLTVDAFTVFIGTLVPLVVALTIQSLPLGAHMLRGAIDQVSVEVEEASYLSGVGGVRTFLKITMPMVVPMFASVFVLTFVSALKDISVTVLLARPGTRTLSLLMFEYASAGQMESAIIIGVIMSVAALLVTVVMSQFTQRLELG